MNTNTPTKYFNINLFVNGKYTGSNPFTGSKKAATRCIARDCGIEYDTDTPEKRTGLRSFWKRYCPKCRTKGNAGSEAIVNTPAKPQAVNDSACPQCGKNKCKCQSDWANSINDQVKKLPSPKKEAAGGCDWQTEYGMGAGTAVCGKPTSSNFPWCAEHQQEAKDNYPQHPLPTKSGGEGD